MDYASMEQFSVQLYIQSEEGARTSSLPSGTAWSASQMQLHVVHAPEVQLPEVQPPRCNCMIQATRSASQMRLHGSVG